MRPREERRALHATVANPPLDRVGPSLREILAGEIDDRVDALERVGVDRSALRIPRDLTSANARHDERDDEPRHRFFRCGATSADPMSPLEPEIAITIRVDGSRALDHTRLSCEQADRPLRVDARVVHGSRRLRFGTTTNGKRHCAAAPRWASRAGLRPSCAAPNGEDLVGDRLAFAGRRRRG